MLSIRLSPSRAEKARYLIGGSYNTVFGYVTFAALYTLLHHRLHYLLILAVAQVFNVLNAYGVYRWFVFRATGHLVADALRFSTVYLLAFLLNLAALPVLIEVVGLTPLVGQAILVAVAATASYVAHKRFSFRRKLDARVPVS